MSTIHLKASVENGRLVTDLPPELAATATDGATFHISLNLPEPEEDVPLPRPEDGADAYLRYFKSLRSLGDLKLPPHDDHLDLPRRAYGEIG